MTNHLWEADGSSQDPDRWVESEGHRWTLSLLIVLCFHAVAISYFDTWRQLTGNGVAARSVAVIDLSPLPGAGSRGAGNGLKPKMEGSKGGTSASAPTKPHTQSRRPEKLRAQAVHLAKPIEKPPAAPILPLALSETSNRRISPSGAAAREGGTRGTGGGFSGGESAGCCGNGSGSGGVGEGGVANWQSLLLADLEAHKHYPSEARERGEEGIAYLRFTMNREGKVLSFGLDKGSGYADLDQETLDLIQRSQPLPKPPASIVGQELQLTVPIKFELDATDEGA